MLSGGKVPLPLMKGKLVGTLALVIVKTDVEEITVLVVEVVAEAPATSSSVLVSDVSLLSSPSSSSSVLVVKAALIAAGGVEAGAMDIKDPILETVELNVGPTLVPLT